LVAGKYMDAHTIEPLNFSSATMGMW